MGQQLAHALQARRLDGLAFKLKNSGNAAHPLGLLCRAKIPSSGTNVRQRGLAGSQETLLCMRFFGDTRLIIAVFAIPLLWQSATAARIVQRGTYLDAELGSLLIWFGLMLAFGLSFWAMSCLSLELTEDELRWNGPTGGRGSVAWKDIPGYRVEVHQNELQEVISQFRVSRCRITRDVSATRLILELPQGRSLTVVPNYRNHGHLLECLIERLDRALVERARATWQDGGTVKWGPVELGPESFKITDRTVRYQDVRRVSAVDGGLEVTLADGQLVHAEPPNAFAMKTLIARQLKPTDEPGS
jgi:hypothetical protein